MQPLSDVKRVMIPDNSRIKNNIILSWLMVLTLLCFMACKKEKSTQNNTDNVIAAFHCKVNGTDWKSDPVSKEVLFWGRKRPSFKVESYDGALFILAIRSTATDTQAINIEFKPTSAYVGIYNLNESQIYSEGYFYAFNDMSANMTSDYAQNTTIAITSYDAATRRISGTFEIKMKRRYAPFDEVKVTDGVFEKALIQD